MRSALRAYALETTDPTDMLERLDRKMQHFEPEAMATVLCAVLSPGLDQLRISCAGHLPPVIARPGQPARTVDVATDILIGTGTGRARRSVTVGLPPGAVLCLYTDGLVERRGRFLDDGIADLCRAITVVEPEAACALAMAAMATPSPRADDIAMLLLRRDAGGPAS
jgi:phosphoserine phosphatase RsbU/P